MNTQWVGERFIHGLIYVTISLAACFALYKLFLSKSVVNKAEYSAPSKHNLDGATIHIYPCGKFFTYDNKT